MNEVSEAGAGCTVRREWQRILKYLVDFDGIQHGLIRSAHGGRKRDVPRGRNRRVSLVYLHGDERSSTLVRDVEVLKPWRRVEVDAERPRRHVARVELREVHGDVVWHAFQPRLHGLPPDEAPRCGHDGRGRLVWRAAGVDAACGVDGVVITQPIQPDSIKRVVWIPSEVEFDIISLVISDISDGVVQEIDFESVVENPVGDCEILIT